MTNQPYAGKGPERPRRPRPLWWLVVVLLTLSLALDLGAADSLLAVPWGIHLAGYLAVAAAVALLLPLGLFLAGRRGEHGVTAPLLFASLSLAGGSYFVGGAVGPSSPATVLAALLTFVGYLSLAHPGGETPGQRRIRRHRWGRTGIMAGGAVLLVALILFAGYEALPPVQVLAQARLTQGLSLAPGGGAEANLSAGPGDILFALVAATPNASTVQAVLLGPGNVTIQETTAGPPTEPAVLTVSVKGPGGAYGLRMIETPSSGGASQGTEVRWSFVRIPAPDVALGATVTVAGYAGGGALLFSFAVWIGTRPPPPPPPPGTLAYQRWKRARERTGDDGGDAPARVGTGASDTSPTGNAPMEAKI